MRGRARGLCARAISVGARVCDCVRERELVRVRALVGGWLVCGPPHSAGAAVFCRGGVVLAFALRWAAVAAAKEPMQSQIVHQNMLRIHQNMHTYK